MYKSDANGFLSFSRTEDVSQMTLECNLFQIDRSEEEYISPACRIQKRLAIGL